MESNATSSFKSLLLSPEEIVNPQVYQERIISEYKARSRRKNWASGTRKNQESVIRDIIDNSQKYLWELTESDIDRFVDSLIDNQRASSYRRQRLSTFRAFYEWLVRNYSTEIWQLFKLRLVQPVTEDNQITHTYDKEKDFKTPPPSPDMLEYFFTNLRGLMISSCFNSATVARDYTIYKLMYSIGPRMDETIQLDLADLYFEYNKIHIRFGKGANGSGKRERWVPMLRDTDKLLKWYLKHVRPKLKFAKQSKALFPSHLSERVGESRISQQLSKYLSFLNIPEHLHWSSHKFRHAFATHNYENGMRLIVLQDLLGHASIYTTMIYVTPSEKFIEENTRQVNLKIKENHRKLGGYLPWQ